MFFLWYNSIMNSIHKKSVLGELGVTNAQINRRLLFICFVIASIFLFLQMAIWQMTVDDAYIFFRYAKNFADGHGLVFNIGERVEGYSSFVWVMILGLMGKFGFDIPLVAKIISLLSSLATLVVMILLCGKLFGSAGAIGAMAVISLGMRIDYGTHFQSGMESGFHALVLIIALFVYLNSNGRTLYLTGVLAALLIMTHPSGFFFAPAIIAAEIYRGTLLKEPKIGKRILTFFIPLLAITVSHLLWRQSYYGDFLPNTFYAKQVPFEPYFLARGLYHMLKFFAYGGGIFYYVPAVIFSFAAIRNPDIASLIAVIISYIAFNILSSGDWMVYSRFMVPVVPLLMILNSAGLIWLFGKIRQGRAIVLAVIFMLLLSGIQNGLLYTIIPTSELIKTNRIEKVKWVSIGKYFGLMQKTHPDLTIATSAIGALGYYSKARIIDLVGLVDKHIARNGVRYRGGSGHERSDMRYVMSLKPDIYVISAEIDSINCQYKPLLFFLKYTPLNDMPYTAEEVYSHIFENYRYVRLEGQGHEFWIRKDLNYVDDLEKTNRLPREWRTLIK